MEPCILVATDGRPGALGALRTARWLAERRGLRVEVLSIYETDQLYVVGYPDIPGSAPAQFAAVRLEGLKAQVKAQLEEIGSEGTWWPLTVQVGRVAPTIARLAMEKKAVVIVLGLSEHAPFERWFGRESLLRLVHLANVPVLAVAPDAADLPRQVVVAVDFSDFSLRAARDVLKWVSTGARVHLLHVLWGPPVGGDAWMIDPALALKEFRAAAEERLEELAAELEQEGGVETRAHIRTGDPGREVLRLAEEIGADLIASGSHGAGFFGRLVMGSVSSKLAHGASCSLLIAPPQEVPAELLELTEQELLAGLGTAGDIALSNTPAPAD